MEVVKNEAEVVEDASYEVKVEPVDDAETNEKSEDHCPTGT